ncbi:MAG: hypothetical protein HYX75_17275 [Acidobacteria bacterium]|nr:hypothetical protein [Acidobacteriota bacterium]
MSRFMFVALLLLAPVNVMVFAQDESESNKSDQELSLDALKICVDPLLLAGVAVNHQNREFRLAAVEKLTDTALLVRIAINDADYRVRFAALEKINDQKLLADVAMAGRALPINPGHPLADDEELDIPSEALSDASIGADAVRRMTDQALILKVARSDAWWFARREAVSKLIDEAILASFARKDADKRIRRAAVYRLIHLPEDGCLSAVGEDRIRAVSMPLWVATNIFTAIDLDGARQQAIDHRASDLARSALKAMDLKVAAKRARDQALVEITLYAAPLSGRYAKTLFLSAGSDVRYPKVAIDGIITISLPSGCVFIDWFANARSLPPRIPEAAYLTGAGAPFEEDIEDALAVELVQALSRLLGKTAMPQLAEKCSDALIREAAACEMKLCPWEKRRFLE